MGVVGFHGEKLSGFSLSRGKRMVPGGLSAFVKQHNNIRKDYRS